MNNRSTGRYSRIVFFQVFAALVFVMGAFSTNAHAAFFTVNTTADTQDAAPGNGVCADAGGMCSLRAAISEANALAGADTINLPTGTYTTTLAAANEDANAGGDLDITSPLTINGDGPANTIVQANASIQTANERVFHILSGGTAVSLSGMTIQNGVFRYAGATPSAQSGGGIRVEGSTANLTVNNSTITGNYSENRGGGIGVNKANLTVNGCTFTNNSSGSSVAGSASSGGAISIDSEDNVGVLGQNASINNSVINNNRAESSVNNTFGGGIAVRALNANVTVTGCTISNNSSNALNATFSGFAGGISNQQATMTLNTSTVTFNTSSRFHAGVRNLASTAAASTVTINDSTVSNNTSTAVDGQGGGVANIVGSTFNATLIIERSTVNANVLTGTASVGGGVLNVGTVTGIATTNIKNSTVSGNSAHDAAGVYSDGAGATCTVNFSTVASNAADAASGEGGGVFQDVTGGSTLISNSIFADNTASAGRDVSDFVASADYNHVESAGVGFVPAAHDVTGSDPALGALANNGGLTFTHLPGGASVVLNTIPNGTNGCGTTVTNDQRGFGRPAAAGCEKGSVEIQTGVSPTATSTSTPTNTSTNTPTSTSTSTSTNTPTPNLTPTPGCNPCISGTITYANATAPPVFISNATLTGTGSVLVSTTTAAPGGTAGQYTLSGFGAGNYTVGVTKTTGQNGISSNDAARIAQHVIGNNVFTTDVQKVTADVSDNGTLSSNDAALIARYAAGVGAPFGLTGNWRFFVSPPPYPAGAWPTTRTYTDPIGIQTGQDYVGILMGDVTGNWANTGARRTGTKKVSNENDSENTIAVELPQIETSVEKDIVIPVSVRGLANKDVISYEFNLRYDPSVIEPIADVVDVNGTASRGLSFVANPYEPGVLRVVVYGAFPIDENGVLLSLKFKAVGAAGTASSLTLERVMFNEGEPQVSLTDGKIELF